MLKPRLEKYHRNIALFPIAGCIHLWVSDDPDRDWTTMLAPAMEYQINVYSRMGTDAGQPIPAATDPRTLPRQDILIGTPDTIIKRIQGLQKRCLLPSCVSGRTHQEFHMIPSWPTWNV